MVLPRLCTGAIAVALLLWPAGSVMAGVDEDALPTILVSRQLLEQGELAVGEVVRLAASRDSSEARRFRIAGAFEPTPDPMRLTTDRFEVRLHLPDLMEMTRDPHDPQDAESVDAINVTLEDPSRAAGFARDFSARMPGLFAVPTRFSNDVHHPLTVIKRFHLAIAVVTVLGSTAFLLALMVMRADERRETAGILRLVGVTRGRILLGTLIEGLFVAAAGALFGLLLALLSQHVFNRFFQWYYDTALVFVRVSPAIAWRSVLLAVPLGIAAGAVASWTLLRREIVALIRR